MKIAFYLCLASIVFQFLINLTNAAVSSDLESCEDEKCYKNLLKTRPNLLILYSKSDREIRDVLKILKEANTDIKGTATIASINCEKAKKLCKKLKIQPKEYELKYYREGGYSKDYDRQLTKKSLVNFFNDPDQMPWEEEENAKDIVHVNNENALNKLLKKHKVGILVMFYAPWCGYCKKLKPEFAAAATEVKQLAVFAGMNLDSADTMNVKKIYNISGFPTLLYFKSGSLKYNYGGEMTKDGLISWIKDPKPPKEKEPETVWADEKDIKVEFLTTDNFDQFLSTHKSVLVMFYAPWCGYCKTMKPIYSEVAQKLFDEKIDGIIAAVDATKEPKLGERFKLKGYPTVKYFKNGDYGWDMSERTVESIFEFMKNPKQPPPPPPEWRDEPSAVVHLDEENFSNYLKTKKHALVMFYAPWCGHCKNAKPHFTRAAEKFKDDIKISFVAVDCTLVKSVCEQFEVKGFPTIKYLSFGKNAKDYDGGREYDDFVRYMSSPNDQEVVKFDARQDWLSIAGNEHINFLDDTTFDAYIKANSKVLVLFYAPWCGHCTQMKGAYGEAATEMKKFLPGAYLAAVDATKSQKTANQFNVNGFPTLKYFENGHLKFDYDGGRTKDDFVKFMREPKPKKTEL